MKIRPSYHVLSAIALYRLTGRVRRCHGHLVVCEGLGHLVGVGETCCIEPSLRNPHEYCGGGGALLAEVVTIDEAGGHLLPFDRVDGIGIGARVSVARNEDRIRPTEAWRGRVLDAFGRPPDGGPPLPCGPMAYGIKAPPVAAHRRGDLGGRLDLGVHALDLFTPCRQGQRMGI